MNYADPFAVQASTPISRAINTIQLQANVQAHWPSGYTGANYIASITQVNAAADGFKLALPSAKEVDLGTGFLVPNTGDFAFVLTDFGSNTITSIATGITKYFYCTDNSTDAGVWETVTFGAGTSSADAIQLAGLGVIALGGKLSAGHPVSTSASNVTIDVGSRASIYIATGGSANVNVPNHSDVGNNFFFGAHNAGSGTLTVQPVMGETIDGYASLALAPNESVFVFCSGTDKWYTIGYGRSTQFQFTKLVKDISAGGTFTLTSAEASNKLLQFIGTPASNATVNVPSVVGIYYVQNAYSGSNSLTIKTVAGSGVALGASDRAILYCDGTNVVAAQSVAVGSNLSIIDGTLSAPAISFAADSNTGIYRADLETVGLVSDGAESARFSLAKSSVIGKFGVGTINPSVQLHVKAGVAEAIRVQGTGAYMTFYDTAGTGRFGYIAGQAGELKDFVDGDSVRSFYINGVARAALSSTGLIVNGAIIGTNFTGVNTGDQDLSGYATKAGGNVFTGVQVMQSQRSSVLPLGNIVGAKNIDLALAGTFTGTVTGVCNFTFSNSPPAGQDQTVYLKLTNGGAFGLSWPAGTRFPNGGVQPTLVAAGKDLLAIWYDVEQGVYVVGNVWKDYR